MYACRQCTHCKDVKTIEEFYPQKKGPMLSSAACKECLVLRQSASRSTRTGRFNTLLVGARTRTKKYNRGDFDVTVPYIESLWDKQQGICPYTGRRLVFETNHPDLVSLDRIDSSKGYVRDNIQLVTTAVNKMKLDQMEEDFLRICIDIAEHTQNSKTPNNLPLH